MSASRISVHGLERTAYTNTRGHAITGESFDGGLDGWPWHAWSGEFIAYGPDEEHALRNLAAKIEAEEPQAELTDEEPTDFGLDGRGTIAEQVARLFGDDGQTWETADGVEFVHVVIALAVPEDQPGNLNVVRHNFTDGSAIVETPGGWDLARGSEGDARFEWAGVAEELTAEQDAAFEELMEAARSVEPIGGDLVLRLDEDHEAMALYDGRFEITAWCVVDDPERELRRLVTVLRRVFEAGREQEIREAFKREHGREGAALDTPGGWVR